MKGKTKSRVFSFFEEQVEAKEHFMSMEKEYVTISVRMDKLNLFLIDKLADRVESSRSAFCSDLLISAVRDILEGLEAGGDEVLTYDNLLNEFLATRNN